MKITYKIILTLWYIEYHLLTLSLYISLYTIWYFSFPNKEKIKQFLLADDYGDTQEDVFYREWEHGRNHVTVYANEIFKIWNIKPIRVSTNEYFEKHCTVTYFEKPIKNKN